MRRAQPDIISDLRQFVERDFYNYFPKLRGNVSLFVTGSVAAGNQDKLSDIDVELACASAALVTYYMKRKSEYNQHLRKLGKPIQFHRLKTFATYAKLLKDWNNDNILREWSSAIVIDDPHARFARLQQKHRYYPKNVHREKINWLFAEMNFNFYERYRTASTRRSRYFCDVVKINIIRLALNAVLLSNNSYPAYDKHLYKEVEKFSGTNQFLKLSDKILNTRDLQKIERLLQRMIQMTEQQLLTKRFIVKKSSRYWIDLRPQYKVQFS